jgi:hypothetical protein
MQNVLDRGRSVVLAHQDRLVSRIVCCCAACPAGIIGTATYDVNVPFMQLERRGWDIHAV